MNSADVDRCEPEVQPARHNMAQSSPKICVLFRTTKKSWIFGCVKLCQISLILQSNRDILCVFLAYQSFCAITWLEKGQKIRMNDTTKQYSGEECTKIRNHHHPSSHFQRTPFCQWIGFLGKILTGNHRFSHEDYGAFRLKFSLKPIH